LVATACPLAAVAQSAPGGPAPGPPPPPSVESAPVRTTPAAEAAAPAPGPSQAARRNATAEIRDEDLLLLSADLDGLTITDALPAYGQPDDPLLPVGELARLLDLNLTVSPADGKILGRVGQAEKPVTIDLAGGVYRLAGSPIALAPSDIAVSNVDIYLKASALQRVLPVTIKSEPDGLLLHIHALEKLPIQARLDRLAQLRGLRPDTEQVEESLHVPSPYRLFTMPGFDIQGQLGASFTAPRFTHSYDVRIASDLAFTGFQGFLGADDNGDISSFRATFERHDVKGNLLGPIHATSMSGGDTFTPGLAVGPRSVGGRGFAFSTAPLEQTSVFNRIDLRGEMPVGYDVELYVNDILRSGQRTPVNGRYEFLNVPLVRGVNVIRIVLNGPRGERSEETRIINVSGGQLAPGAFNFQMGAVQQDTPLFNVGKQDPTAAGSDILSPGVGKLRATASAAYGLTNRMTLVGGAAVFPALPTTRRNPDGTVIPQFGAAERGLATIGLRTAVLGASVQMDAALDSTRAGAVALGVAAQPFGLNLLGRQVFYKGDFIDETVGTGTGDKAIVSHTELNIDLNAHPFKGSLVPLTLRGTSDVYADHSSNITGGFRASATADNILLSGGLDLNAQLAPGQAPSYSTVGNLSASTFYQFKWQLRASLDYVIRPKPSLTALTVTADRDISDKMALRLGLGRDLSSGDGDTNLQIGDIVHTRFGDLSLTGNYAMPSQHWQVGMSFAIGLIFDPISKRYVFTRPGPAQGGAMALRAFMDANGNGAMDPGEKPVPLVTVDGGEHRGTTGSDGHALVIGLGQAPTGRVQVGLDNIDDPYVVSPPKTITFNPRPGQVVVVPYPLTASAELITHVKFRQGDKLVGLSAVRVRLVKRNGKGAPFEASTEFDGSAGFESLGVGTYDFELDPEQAARLHMHLAQPVQVVVPPQGGPIPDVSAEVVFDRPAPAEPATTEPTPQA
jgi:hypothetical protein